MIIANPITNLITITKDYFTDSEMELFSCLNVKVVRGVVTIDPRHVSKMSLTFMIKESYPEIYNNPELPSTKLLYFNIKQCYDYYFDKFKLLMKERLWYADKLYNHQPEVVFFSTYRKVSVLACEQGLGKTIIAMSDSMMHNYKLTVVITTATSKWNWFEDLTDVGKSPSDIHWGFDPRWFTVLDGKKTLRANKDEERIILINYDMLHKFGNELIQKKPQHIIIDECHKIKNRDSKRSKRVIDVCKTTNAKVSLLSGTPSPNRTVDFYNYLKVANHPYGYNYYKFLNNFAETIETKFGKQIVGAKNTPQLNRAISNLMIRKTKAKCLDLPEKKYIKINFELHEYKEMYEKMLEDFLRSNKKYSSGQELAIHSLNKLIAKAKVKDAIELIDTILEEDNTSMLDNGKEVTTKKKVAIYTTYQEPIQMLKAHYKDACVVIDGTVDSSKRMQVVKEFRFNDKVNLFIGQTEAAGESLNMTFCNDLILLNYLFTRSGIDQITDRFHRIGLKKMLNVYMTTCRDSIDEALYSLFTRKHAETSQLIDGRSEYLDTEDIGMRQLILTLLEKETVTV